MINQYLKDYSRAGLRIAASKARIPLAEFVEKTSQGLRYCKPHKTWHSINRFNKHNRNFKCKVALRDDRIRRQKKS